jgi:O-antigen/teichoic acid export membrane protein
VIAANLSSFILHYSDRYFLRAYDSLEAVGLYSLAYKFAMLMSLFIATPFAQIWAPKALEIEKGEAERARPILRRILSYYNVALVGTGLGIALFAGDVIRVMAAPEFHAADRTVPVLCLAMLFFGYRQVSYIGAAIRERSDLIGLGTAAAAGVVLVGNFLLIPRWGAMGAATATLLAFAGEFAIVMTASERVYGLRYPMARLFAPVVLAVATYGGVRWILPDDAPLGVSLSVKVLAFALFFAVLLLRSDLARPRMWRAVLAPLRTR